MQGIYRPTEVQSLAAPSRRRRPRVHPHAFGSVLRSRRLGRVVWHRRRWRDVGNDSTIRAPKSKLAVGLSIDLISLFVHSAMMAAAQQHEV